MSGSLLVLVLCTSACSQILGLGVFGVAAGADAATDGAPADAYSIAEQAYIKASNTGTGDIFGYSIAISANGDTLAVGARQESSAATGINGNQADNSAMYSGAAYVFTRSGTTWTQQAYIKASNTGAGDWFGFSIALSASGDTLVVGAFSEDSAATGVNPVPGQADNTASGAGAAYVFHRSGATWTQQAYLKASNTGAADGFGNAVAISGDGATICVGASGEDGGAMGINGASNELVTDSGAAYVFVLNGATWSQQAYVKASNTATGAGFGNGLALSTDGDTLAIAAVYEAGASDGINGDQAILTAAKAGAVYVFTRMDSAVWSQQAYVKASNTDAGDEFGDTIALSGDGATLAVGAANESSAATGIDGNQLDNSLLDAGAVYLYARSGAMWSQTTYVKASNTDAGDSFARVALSPDGTMLAVGAQYEDSAAKGIDGDQHDNTATNSGAAYLFGAGGEWHQIAYLKSSNTGSGWAFGIPALASGTLAVSAFGEPSDATGINGLQTDTSAPSAGAVYVFE